MFPLDGTLSHITVHQFTVMTLVESNVVVVVLPLPVLPLLLCLHFTISQREIIILIFYPSTFILQFLLIEDQL